MPPRSGGGSISRAASPNPMTGTSLQQQHAPKAYARAGSPNPAALARDLEERSRRSSPSTTSHTPKSPRPSFTPDGSSHTNSRAPSPAPSAGYLPYSRGPSPIPHRYLESSPPPPAPPPHRVAYSSNRPVSPVPSSYGQYPNGSDIPRQATPPPPSSAVLGNTPSPLRSAMEDVISSLQDMTRGRESAVPDRSRSPINPWSPEAFEQQPVGSSRSRYERPVTSLGIGGLEAEQHSERESPCGSSRYLDDPPQLSNYVQRMESRLRQQGTPRPPDELFFPGESRNESLGPPPVPPKNTPYERPRSALSRIRPGGGSKDSSDARLRNRKSAYDLGKDLLGRTFTTKSTVTSASSAVQSTTTNESASTQMTSQSIMSGYSAGGFSATSAGSLARRRGAGGERPVSVMELGRNGYTAGFGDGRPETPFTGVTYHSSHNSGLGSELQPHWAGSVTESGGLLGGLTAPKPKKSGFFKKIIESAKTGAASARSTIASGQVSPSRTPVKSTIPNGTTAITGGSVAREMGLSGNIDWVQVRRDVNRSNSLSRIEKIERRERRQMMDENPVLHPVDVLYETAEGDEGLDGLPVAEPTNFSTVNLSLVDKAARFINNLPPMINSTALAQGYVCRPYRSDVQRLRAIFTWVSEKVAWEEDFEGQADSRRVIQTKRGCAEEVAVLVSEMCAAVGIHAEVIRGYLKAPGELIEGHSLPNPNHWWNAVIVDGEWRVIDCSLAGLTNPRRGQYSSLGSQVAEAWWFLTRPLEACYTHIPVLPEHQHICPPLPHWILLALPCACPPYFKNGLQMFEYDTSLLKLEDLEMAQIDFVVPPDTECVAEVETRSFARDSDGDYFESGELTKKRALAQAEWIGGQKVYRVKALLPGDEGQGVLKVYAGKRGLMHSIKDIPHALAFAVPILHSGENPPYEFLSRHPTPHAQRHDLYVAQPQCARLAINNTFVFVVRQHPSSLSSYSPNPGSSSPVPFTRPSSAMSTTNSSAAGSSFSQGSSVQKKPAKLAIQAPSGKIMRLMRKNENTISTSGLGGSEVGDGSVWETIIKIGERGLWRALVLADRSARWCVFAEWDCV
ncbi:MAG: cytokinesis protein 3 [Geoglossum umbratile]|nr:MAG: cytokinesis protein 3 [Geoglossum umbratile]